MKLYIVPNLNQRNVREITQSFIDYTHIFNNVSLGDAMKTINRYKENGNLITTECFIYICHTI